MVGYAAFGYGGNCSSRRHAGGSNLGTLDAPYLPRFLENNPLPHKYPWGKASVNETNPYVEVPNTGFIRSYHFVLSRGWVAPDGVQNWGVLINGQFPGPLIEANWGDTIQVTVENKITGPEEGTSLHWHGLLQKETPWFDGVPSVSQCPVAPNSTFTYSFKADSYGSSWYHSHYSAQYADGLFGPMVIYGPSHVGYDVDVGPIVLSDHFHSEYFKIVEAITGKTDIPNSDNNLINGKMNYDCSLAKGYNCTPNAGLSKFKFQSGKKHRLRLINAGAEGLQKFTIDSHTMTVIANDFVPVKPYKADVITLGVGQRTDIIVEGAGKPTDAVWMRSDISTLCSHTNQSHALAAIYYEEADTSATPTSVATKWNDTNCANDPLELTEPFFQDAPPKTPAFTQTIDVDFGPNATQAQVWKMNNESFRANYDHPLLLLTKLGNTSYPYDPQWNVYNFHSNTSLRLIIRSLVPLAHPMHLHGHNFWVVAQGTGEWNGTVTRPHNPQRRDTQMLERGIPTETGMSYIVLDFQADNPGVWPLHCHVAWHVSDGLYVNIMERPDLVMRNRQIPSIMAQTCRDWAAYSGHNVVEQIDSGL
ncbi:uncharacterized protein A1O5_10986 [Cladophialophora psammophila CBS 110553]|uniref:Multicopper oxidase n=1 Tax=Cladophialophora psammophila CBS 110553 TaxID=1182543 RepID=W9X6C6_9EURO|nr:uncharacterized protein A1O5_10986 [Cladophialophora psammophila CBS 110553]EXJ66009.1 hypothetical protein A1O5_10986 [Cladophialophora psammophila CBS 110553]